MQAADSGFESGRVHNNTMTLDNLFTTIEDDVSRFKNAKVVRLAPSLDINGETHDEIVVAYKSGIGSGVGAFIDDPETDESLTSKILAEAENERQLKLALADKATNLSVTVEETGGDNQCFSLTDLIQ